MSTCGHPSPGGSLRCTRQPHVDGGHLWDMEPDHRDDEQPQADG